MFEVFDELVKGFFEEVDEIIEECEKYKEKVEKVLDK